jgi:hypothetical protein
VFGGVGTGPLTTLPVIFYGEELVSSKNPFWGLFPAIERMQIHEERTSSSSRTIRCTVWGVKVTV